MNDLISIIVPVYNIENYIKKCIHSILDQLYTNLEIIIVDDGSTDGSGKTCEELMKTDARIHVIHEENSGLSEARNTGLKAAHGKYIIFIDGDDYIEKEMVSKLYQCMVRDQSDLVLCNIHFVDEGGNYISAKEKNLENKILCEKNFWEGYYGTFVYPYVVSWNKLYKKELFEHTFFEKGRIHEDEFILHKIISQCKRISVINDKLYNYVQRTGSITNTKYNIKRLQVFDAMNGRLEYFYTNYPEYIEPTMEWMLGNLIRATVNLDLSNAEHRIKLREYVRIYKKRLRQYHKILDNHLIFKSVLFIYAKHIYLLLRKKAYTDK